jgi:hypothetical protein
VFKIAFASGNTSRLRMRDCALRERVPDDLESEYASRLRAKKYVVITAEACDPNRLRPQEFARLSNRPDIIHALRRETGIRCSKIKVPTYVGEWLSLVEHLVRDQGVGGSNPLSPTN